MNPPPDLPPTATVLVVDDNPTNLKLAADVLEAEGYTVLRAGDAAEAQTVLSRLQPDLILMDIQMPGMDGLTLTRLLKENPVHKHIHIVALTAFAMKGDDRKAIEAGCDAYITKPVETRRLAAQIAAILQPTPVPQTKESRP